MSEYDFSKLDLNSNWGEFIHSNLLKETLVDTAKAIQEVADSISVPVNVDGSMVEQDINVSDSLINSFTVTYLPCNLKASDNTMVYLLSRLICTGTVTKGFLSSDELYKIFHGEFNGISEDGQQINQRCQIELTYDGKKEIHPASFNLSKSMFRVKSDESFKVTADNIKIKIVGLL